MNVISQGVDVQARVTGAIGLVAADFEAHCRAMGQDYLRRGKPVPEWLWDDMALALELQGVLS